jgi:hypothetical protein
MKKGAEVTPRPFLIYKSIISIPTHRTANFSYFPSHFNDLRGKPSKRGLDKIGENRGVGLEALLVGSRGLADANVIDAIGWF